MIFTRGGYREHGISSYGDLAIPETTAGISFLSLEHAVAMVSFLSPYTI